MCGTDIRSGSDDDPDICLSQGFLPLDSRREPHARSPNLRVISGDPWVNRGHP